MIIFKITCSATFAFLRLVLYLIEYVIGVCRSWRQSLSLFSTAWLVFSSEFKIELYFLLMFYFMILCVYWLIVPFSGKKELVFCTVHIEIQGRKKEKRKGKEQENCMWFDPINEGTYVHVVCLSTLLYRRNCKGPWWSNNWNWNNQRSAIKNVILGFFVGEEETPLMSVNICMILTW